MNIENQVANLELSKKLKELGVKQESLFYHDLSYGRGSSITRAPERVYSSQDVNSDFISAFTVAELGEMLPAKYFSRKIKDGYISGVMRIEMLKEHEFNIAMYFDSTESDIEADARAKMLIYLLENKLIK